MVSLPSAPPASGLPPEFTLQLGPQSAAQVASLARILKDLGAEVELCHDGGLVAVRPSN